MIQSNSPTEYFSHTTSNALRAIAVIFLIAGHFSMLCLKGGNHVLGNGGEWAVLIFLIVSAMGTSKAYGLDGCGKRFIYRRIIKIMFPLWLSLGLFFGLDYAILHRTYPLQHIMLEFLGILPKAPPNAPAWFVSFIIYLYLIFFLVSNVSMPKYLKCIAFIFISFGTTILIHRVPVAVTIHRRMADVYVCLST